MKCSRPSAYNDGEVTLHGTPYFKKPGLFIEENIDIGDRNNCPQVNLPNLTVFLIEQCRQTHKGKGEGCYMLAKVNRIKDPTPEEIALAKDYENESDFVACTYPDYEKETGKLLGIKEEITIISVLRDPNGLFFDNGFGGEKKPLWSGYKRNKLPNPVNFTMPSFMKRPRKENLYDPNERCEIYCFASQLCDRSEEANKSKGMPYIPFIEVDKKMTLGENFMPTDLIGLDQDKSKVARKAVLGLCKLMCKENKKRIVRNMNHVIKKLEDANYRKFHICGEKYNNDFSNSRIILN